MELSGPRTDCRHIFGSAKGRTWMRGTPLTHRLAGRVLSHLTYAASASDFLLFLFLFSYKMKWDFTPTNDCNKNKTTKQETHIAAAAITLRTGEYSQQALEERACHVEGYPWNLRGDDACCSFSKQAAKPETRTDYSRTNAPARQCFQSRNFTK